MKRVAKPSGACAEKLAKMFPATKGVPQKRSDVFDPLEDCVALPAQKKKKGSRIKPVNIQMVVLPKNESSILPKGKKRQKLVNEGRIKTIEVKRTMSEVEVGSRIKHGFAHLSLTKWEYLDVHGRYLMKSSTQSLGGEVADRRGAVYIRENNEECQVCKSLNNYGCTISKSSLL